MQVTKQYKKGGFLQGSKKKFAHMAGAEGGFDRKEFRDLRRRKRKGESLTGVEGQRLNYMKNVRKDRTAKGIITAALLAATGGAALAAAPAAGAAGAAGAGAAGAAGAGAAGAGTAAAGTAAAGAGAAGAGTAAGTAATTAGGAGLSGLASKAGSLLSNPKTQKAIKLAQQVSKGSNLPANFGQTQSAPVQPLPTMQVPNIYVPSQGLMTPGANVGQGVLPIQEFDQPEENFDSEIESVDQGVQDFDQGEENFDDGSGFNLMEALQQFSNFYTGAKGMKVLKGGQKRLDKNNDGKITAEDFKLLRAMLGARLPR